LVSFIAFVDVSRDAKLERKVTGLKMEDVLYPQLIERFVHYSVLRVVVDYLLLANRQEVF
jgi:hypothetical protein